MDYYKIKTILIPTDFSESANQAFAHAVRLAKKLPAKLVMMHAVESLVPVMSHEVLATGYIHEQMLDASRKALDELTNKLEAENAIKVRRIVCSGNVYDNIIRAAHIYNADLIVMGTHGTTGLKELLFGSNAFSVVHNTTIPVLTINLESDKKFIHKIVFPYSEEKLTLKKINQVLPLAKALNATILLFGYVANKLKSDYITLLQKGQELKSQFESMNITCSLSLEFGEHYATDIMLFAIRNNADLITVSSSKGHSVDNLFKAKPDKTLVNHSKIPVLSIPVE